jgi:hypothetical protein
MLVLVGQLAQYQGPDLQFGERLVLRRGDLPERRVRLHQSVEGLTPVVRSRRLETGRRQQVLPAPLRHQPGGQQGPQPGVDGRFRIPIDEGPDGLRVGGEEVENGPVGGGGGVHARRS